MNARVLLRGTTLLGAGLLTGWLVGLFFFAQMISAFQQPTIDAALTSADAIVVLTGGSERLGAGLELLAAGKGQKLLISGVYPGLSLDRVLANQAVPQNLRACCISVGYAAADTLGNAEETRVWMAAQNLRSLWLVTAHYHMPRSLAVFHRALPGHDIRPFPVAPDNVKLERWWLRPGTAGLIISEYNKFLFVALRAGVESWL